MLFVFFVSIFGFAFAFRIARHFVEQNLIRKSDMTKIGTTYLACVLILATMFSHSRFAVWLIVFLPLVLIMIGLEILVSGRAQAFRRDFGDIVSFVILKMKSGHSFRHSFADMIAECDERYRSILSEIASVVAFSQQDDRRRFDPFIAEIVDELIVIDRQPHSAAKRLEVLRERLKVENDFRRKSGQVLSRIRAQSLVMTALFVAVLGFMSVKFGFRNNAQVIFASTFLFICGGVWIWIGGRRIKWKV